MKRARAVASLALASLLVAGSGFAQEPLAAGVDGVPSPKKTKHVQPVYPPDALAQGVRGIVILELVVDPSGHVASASVLRGIPGLDEAAIAAAKQWEYEPVKVNGKPVSVRMTQSIAFALQLPRLARESGVPELRQGVAPVYPAGASGPGAAIAEVSLEADGRVGSARIVDGNDPFAGALLKALQTWRFSLPPEDSVVSFRVRADFAPGRGASDAGRVLLQAGSLHKEDLLAPPSASPAAAPAAAAVPPTATSTDPTAAVDKAAAEISAAARGSSASTDASQPGTPAGTASAAQPATPAPAAAAAPPATPAPAPSAPASQPAAPAGQAAAPASAPASQPAAPAGQAAAPASAPASQPAAPATPAPAAQPSAQERDREPHPATPPPGAPAAPGSAPDAGTPPRTPPGQPGSGTPADQPPASPGGTRPVAPAPGAPVAGTPGTNRQPEGAAPPPQTDRTAPPPVEVITAPRPQLPPENGVSAIRDVTLEPGVPDLTGGRRPVAPPLARMAGASGKVEVQFSVSAAGGTTVQKVEGPDLLKKAAEQAVTSWTFRRTRADRAYLAAVFTFEADNKTSAVVRPQAAPAVDAQGAGTMRPATLVPTPTGPVAPPDTKPVPQPERQYESKPQQPLP